MVEGKDELRIDQGGTAAAQEESLPSGRLWCESDL